jgi:hypothetical protein
VNSDTITTFSPDDPEWDTISAFTGKPLTQAQREANDLRRAKNEAMYEQMPGDVSGHRLFRVNRRVPTGGTQENPRFSPTTRSFLVRALTSADAKAYVQAQIDGMLDGLPGKRAA